MTNVGSKMTDSFESDAPIAAGQDELDRQGLADELANLVVGGKLQNLSIAIHAPWGSGKSSFLNLLEASVKLDSNHGTSVDTASVAASALVIRFEADDLIKAKYPYLKILSRVLDDMRVERDSGEEENLESKVKFARKLFKLETTVDFMEVGKDLLLGSLERLAHKFAGSRGKEVTEKMWRKLIDSKIDSKCGDLVSEIGNANLLVLIDEVDRIPKESIASLLTVSRKLSEISQCLVILAYDRGQLLQKIQSQEAISVENSLLFLEKYVQIEVELPPLKSDFFVFELSKLLNSEEDRGNTESLSYVLGTYFSNPRVWKRFSNSFRFNKLLVKHEYLTEATAIITFFQLYYPEIYRLILKFRETLTWCDERFQTEVVNRLRSEEDSDFHLSRMPSKLSRKVLVWEIFGKKVIDASPELRTTSILIDLVIRIFPFCFHYFAAMDSYSVVSSRVLRLENAYRKAGAEQKNYRSGNSPSFTKYMSLVKPIRLTDLELIISKTSQIDSES